MKVELGFIAVIISFKRIIKVRMEAKQIYIRLYSRKVQADVLVSIFRYVHYIFEYRVQILRRITQIDKGNTFIHFGLI